MDYKLHEKILLHCVPRTAAKIPTHPTHTHLINLVKLSLVIGTLWHCTSSIQRDRVSTLDSLLAFIQETTSTKRYSNLVHSVIHFASSAGKHFRFMSIHGKTSYLTLWLCKSCYQLHLRDNHDEHIIFKTGYIQKNPFVHRFVEVLYNRWKKNCWWNRNVWLQHLPQPY